VTSGAATGPAALSAVGPAAVPALGPAALSAVGPAVVGVGFDLVPVARMARSLERTPGLVRRLFTPAEQVAVAAGGAAVASALFAVKEAVMKALGGGIDTIGFTDIEVSPGPPVVVGLSGRAATLAGLLGVGDWEVVVGPPGRHQEGHQHGDQHGDQHGVDAGDGAGDGDGGGDAIVAAEVVALGRTDPPG